MNDTLKLSRKLRPWDVLKRFLSTFFPVVTLLAVITLVIFNIESRSKKNILENNEKITIEQIKNTISSDVEIVVSDLLILSEHQELQRIIEGMESESRGLENNFFSFTKRKRLYDQVRLLDEAGMEVVRVNFSNGSPYIVPKDQLQFKGKRYYFKDTISLKKGEVYVSPFDLNIEQGRIEEPLKSIVRFGTPVFDSNGGKRGIVLLNYLGEKMISNIGKISGNAKGDVMLLNSDGFWLKGPRTQDEWGFMYEDRGDRRFGNSFPGAWQQISSARSGQFYNANGLFTFNTVSPHTEVMKYIKDSGMAFIAGTAHLSEDEYNWKIVSRVSPDILTAGYRRVTDRLILMDGILVVIMAAGSLFFARSMAGQKLAEDALHQREEQYRGLVETSIDAIISVNEERRILRWNSASENIFGYLKDEIIGKQVDILVPEKYKQRHINGFRNFFENKEANSIGKTLEVEGLHKDGTIIPIEISVSALKTGNSYIFTSIIRDITERKQVNEELARHREQLEKLIANRTSELESANKQLKKEISERRQAEEERKLMALFAELSPSPALRFNRNGRVLMANPSAVEILGSDSLIGMPLTSILPGIEGFDLSACIQDASIFSYSTQIGNSFFHFILRGIPELGIGQIYGNDITEQKKAETDALRVSHLASLGELAAGVAHEINNPINGIINYAQILVKNAKNNGIEYDIAGQIIREGDRIANIVKNLLSFARERKEEKISVNIHEILSETFALTEKQLRKNSIKFTVNIPSGLHKIFAHPQQIEQVFLNIISNARYALNQKYPTPDENKILEITGKNVTADGCQYVRIIFYDKGTGIPANILDKVMNPFFTTKPSGRGTGLGLSISHGIINDHVGKISLDTAEGEFTRVVVDLPVKGDA